MVPRVAREPVPDAALQDPAKVPQALEDFKAKWKTEAPAFYAYFEKEWLAQLKYKMWIAAFRDRDTPNTTGPLESYHGVIKLLFTNTRCAWVLLLGFTSRCWVLQAA